MADTLDYETPLPEEPPLSKLVVLTFIAAVLTFAPMTCLVSAFIHMALEVDRGLPHWAVRVLFQVLPWAGLGSSVPVSIWARRAGLPPLDQRLADVAAFLALFSTVTGYFLGEFVITDAP